MRAASQYAKLIDILTISKTYQEPERWIDDIVNIIGISYGEICIEYNRASICIQDILADDEQFMRSLSFFIVKEAHYLLEHEGEIEVFRYLNLVKGYDKVVRALHDCWCKRDPTSLVKKELSIEVLLRMFHDNYSVDKPHTQTDTVHKFALNAKLKANFMRILQSRIVEPILVRIRDVAKYGKQAKVQKKAKGQKLRKIEMDELQRRLDDVYIVDMLFMEQVDSSVTMSGLILINAHSLVGTRLIKDAITILLILHEIAHIERKLFGHNGNVFSSTPPELNSESGRYLECQISKNMPKAIDALLSIAKRLKKTAAATKTEAIQFCKAVCDVNLWIKGTIRTRIDSFADFCDKNLVISKSEGSQIAKKRAAATSARSEAPQSSGLSVEALAIQQSRRDHSGKGMQKHTYEEMLQIFGLTKGKNES